MRAGTMGLAGVVSRYLLGIMFTVFGLNGFIHFLKMPPPTAAVAGQFMGALLLSHFLIVVFAVELICGVLLLVGKFVRLALVVLGAVIVNIILYHATMDPKGLSLAVITFLFWIFAAFRDSGFFSSIFDINAGK